MKTRWKWIAAGVGVVALAAALAPWTFSGAAVRHEIARQVRDTIGLVMESEGRTTLALLPRPRIKVADVVIRSTDGSLRMQAGILRGDLRILPMFAGRLELGSVTLVGPQLDIDIEAKPLSREGAIARASEARPQSPEAESADGARLGRVSIQHGVARIRGAARGLDARIENIDLTLDWPSLRAPASVKANFLWNNEAVEAAAWVGKPSELLRGENSAVSIKVDSPSLAMSANGSIYGLGGLRYQGKLSVSAPSLSRLASLAGARLPLPAPLQKFTLVATARTTTNSLALSDMRMSIDGNAYDGALMYSTERGTPVLSGTLATDLLNIPTISDDLPRRLATPSRTGAEPETSATRSQSMEADLRVSATRVRLGRLQAKDVGFNLQLGEGRAELGIAEAAAYGGLLKGRLRFEPAPTGTMLRANLAFTRIDSSALLAETLRSQRISGVATGDLALSAEGDTLSRIVSGLNGNMRLSLGNGEVAGLDLEQALRRLEKRPLSIASEMRSGRTSFTRADIALSFDKGDISIRQADVRGPGVEFTVGGTASIPARNLNLAIRAHTATTGETSRPRPQLALELTGTWDDPRIILDTQSLIRRSEAAAPLFRGLTPEPAPNAAEEPAPN